ncbi:hypothetical protein [Methylopila sp. 73B]|uniref:DUF6950 family protein n=1 Tax=Methylopila sp. 73B TaxID=1120792 RepID=UPI00037AE2ED|nr:hypothetical protein [Methylopila sp. 73B]
MLADFLKGLARTRFGWGAVDCVLAPADWWLMNTGCDPAGDLRGAYASEADAELLFFREGCLPRLVARRMAAAGARRARDPNPGDVAVVRAFLPDGSSTWFGAIMTPAGRWAIKCADGLSVRDARDVRVVAAWSFA